MPEDLTAEIERIKERLARFDMDGFVPRGTLTDASKVMLASIEVLKAEQAEYNRWLYTVKGATVAVPIVLAMLAWWILDLNTQVRTKVSEHTRQEMLMRLNERITALERQHEETNNRLDRLRDRLFQQYQVPPFTDRNQ